MNERVLLVDDEPLILEALRRHLARKYTVATAGSALEGLELVAGEETFAVVISDMRMPGMSGAVFLERVHDLSPDSVRMILSGHAELESAIAAVNLGRIFRFLTKPCTSDELLSAVESGIEQYELVTSRRELLEKTLHGAVQVLTEILGLTNPAALQRASRIARYAEKLCAALNVPMQWQLRIAIMVSQIGCITLPEEILASLHAGQALSAEAEAIYRSHPELAAKLLGEIPRLETVAEIVARQLNAPDFAAQPDDLGAWNTADFGAAILKLCSDLDTSLVTGVPRERAVRSLLNAHPDMPASLVAGLQKLEVNRMEPGTAMLHVTQLRVGMIVDEDVLSRDGMLLLSKGQEVTRSILLRLQVIANGTGVVQPFRVVLG